MRCITLFGRGGVVAAGVLIGLLTMDLTAGARASEVETVRIVAREFSYQPSEIDMKAGETVELKLVNKGQLSHNLHMRGIEKETGTIQAGSSDTIRVTAAESGTLEFYCDVPGHEQAGMTGTIAVE